MGQTKTFDEVYAADKGLTFGNIPSEELRDYILITKLSGNALDIGSGDGRDTLFLANAGFYVTAIDISKVALNKILKYSKLFYLKKRIQVINYDVRYWDYPISFFDLVTSATCLDHIPKNNIQPLFEKIVLSLKPEGILFLEVHTVDDPGFGKEPGIVSELSGMILHYFKRNELLKLVEPEFEIIRYEEKMETDFDHGKPHLHGFANVLARKKI